MLLAALWEHGETVRHVVDDVVARWKTLTLVHAAGITDGHALVYLLLAVHCFTPRGEDLLAVRADAVEVTAMLRHVRQLETEGQIAQVGGRRDAVVHTVASVHDPLLDAVVLARDERVLDGLVWPDGLLAHV